MTIFGSITGNDKIREDAYGSGKFGARRRKTDGTVYTHEGTDIIVDPGQELYMPYSGVFARIAYPYADNKAYSGALFVSERIDFKIFYFRPTVSVGEKIEKGQVIGIAQDITQKYTRWFMHPHIHIEITRIDPALIMEVI